jgi:biopolymer transport protein ExbD
MPIIPAPPPRRKPDFTLTMINIVFLLLLFFLTTGSLTNRNEAQADIPFTRDLPLEKLPRPLLLLTADGSLFLDGKAQPRATLMVDAKAALAATGDPDAALNLLAQKEMAARDFLKVAQELRTGGITVQIVTLHQSAAPGGTGQ